MNKFVIFVVVALLGVCICQAQRGIVMPLSDADKLAVLNYHNGLRGAVNARNMPALIYKSSLELWVNNPNQCNFDHTSNAFRSNSEYSYMGENLGLSGANVPITTLMSGWGSEKSAYTYGLMSMDNFLNVGHYTQMMWANTVAVGCVRINCTGVGVGGFTLACNYGPGGNYLNQYPYLLCTSGSCGLLSPSAGGLNLGGSSASPSPAAASASNSPSRTSVASQSNTPSRTSVASQTNTATRTSAASISGSPTISTTGTRTATTTASLSVTPSTTTSASTAPSATPSPVPSCVPRTCSANSCGTIATGCGGSLTCGTCASGSNCVNNVCVACTPTQTCASKQCGTINTGCGTSVSCGSCGTGQICENYVCTANPACKSCANQGANCGTITITGCPIQSCGTCSAGNTCVVGKCTPITCPATCPRNSVCVNGACTCLNGYKNDTSKGNGCTPISVLPIQFDEIYSSTGTLDSWVYAPIALNTSTLTTPELDALLPSSASTRPLWNEAILYSSLELTTISAQVYFGSPSTQVGLGLRVGQGASRNGDAIQWDVDSSGTVDWTLVWGGNPIEVGTQGKGSFGSTPPTSNWNTISLTIVNTKAGGVTYQASSFSINNVPVVQNRAVRPYDVLGGAYLYSSGPSSWRNIMINTRTSLRVAISNCLSSSAFAALVSQVLGIPAANVRVSNVTIEGTCAGQVGTTKRQAAEVGNVFIMSLTSVQDAGSRALASEFTDLALSWDDTLAETGGVTSVEDVDPALLNVEPFSADPVDLTATSGPGTGLSAGAIAGIVVGGVVGLLILAVIAVAIVAAIVFLIVRRNRNTGSVDEKTESRREERQVAQVPQSSGNLEEGTSSNPNSARTPKGKVVDMYELSPRHHKSITGRVPSGYLPDSSAIDAQQS